MAVGDIYEVTMVQIMDTRGLANLFYFEVGTDDSAVDTPQLLETAFKRDVVDTLKALQTDQLQHECRIIRRVSPQTTVGRLFKDGDTGDLGGAALPSSQTFVLNHWSLPSTRQNRGRMLFAGLREPDVKYGRLLYTAWNTFNTWGQTLLTPKLESGIQFDIRHWNRKDSQYNVIEKVRSNPCVSKARRRTPRRCSIL